MKEHEDYVSDEEMQGDEEFMTTILPEATLVIIELVKITFVTMEFTDVSPKDNTLIFPKPIHVITGIAEALHEDLPDKLPPTRNINTSLI